MSPASLPSHTNTQQWQSFEVRMRRRRAERCVLRAEVALEAGFEEDAREALEEARRLDPGVPDLPTLLARVHERQVETADPVENVRPRARWRHAAAAGLLLAALGSAAVWPSDSPPEAALDAGGAAPLSVEGKPADVQLPARIQLAAVTGSESPVTTAAPQTAEPEPAPPIEPERAEPKQALPAPAANDVAAPIPALEVTTAPLDRVADALPAAPAPEVGAASGPAEPPAASEAPRIRATLARFESAYSALDLDAAQAVWPSVDAPLLSRAFDSLASQRVDLGLCSITVNGMTARAECSGTATWTPKIGGGTHSEARRWTFDLASAGGAWRIVKAEGR